MIKFNGQSGQVIIILLIVVVIVLTVGVTISQRATSDISISTQSEQSSQAFSAAEAGLERAIQSGTSISNFSLGNSAEAEVTTRGKMPFPGSTLGIEYPPIDKETAAQFWLTDTAYPYLADSFEVYFGNPDTFNSTDNIAPAIEVNVVSLQSGSYTSYRYYYDSDPNRNSGAQSNNFNSCTPSKGFPRDTILASSSDFYCKAAVPPNPCTLPLCKPFKPNAGTSPSLVRIRVLYANKAQKVAIFPIGAGNFFPPQIEVYHSTGTSGNSQVTLQYFKQHNLVPDWFDFAIFSVNDINK